MPHLYRNLSLLVGVILAMLLLVQPAIMAQPLDHWVSPRRQEGNGGWISDRADLLDWPTERHLNRRINKLVGRTSAELAIATSPQLKTGQSPHTFALNLFNAWGIGDRDRNNGVLLFVSPADRRVEVITGKGLSDVLPDVEVSRLIQQEMVPAFQQQNYATGITQGIQAIAQRLETRLPSTIFPSWMPDIMVWAPWMIAIGGAGFAIVRTMQVLVLSFTPVRVPVPTQGINTSAFEGSSYPLANDPLPRFLAKVVTPKDRAWEQEIPDLLTQVLVGGWIFGIGLVYGFWQFVLMHPEAEIWQSDATAWKVLGSASSAWFLWGILVASRFVTRDWPWFSFPLALVAAALLAGLGGILVYGMTTAWWWSALWIMGLAAMLGAGAWVFLVNPNLRFKRQREHCSDRTGNPIQELTTQELASLLSPAESLAQSMGKLEFRGWREAELPTPLAREQVYLVRRTDGSASVCAHCKSYAVEVSEQTVEKTIETTKKIDQKRKEVITSVKTVRQTVYTCHFCGCVFAYDQWEPSAIASSHDSSDYPSSDLGTNYSSSSNDNTSSSYDNTYSNDYGSSSSSDFGGGSSDGGGAGSDW